MTFAYGRPWAPEDWKEVIPVFCDVKNREGKVKKGWQN